MDADLRATQIALVLTKWDDLTAWIRRRGGVALEKFCTIELIGPNAIEYDDSDLARKFEERYGLAARLGSGETVEPPQTRAILRGGFKISEEVFPILEAFSKEELLVLRDPDVDPMSVFFGSSYELDVQLLSQMPVIAANSQNYRRIHVFLQAFSSQIVAERADNPLTQMIAFLGTARLCQIARLVNTYKSEPRRLSHVLGPGLPRNGFGEIIMARVFRVLRPILDDYEIECDEPVLHDLLLIDEMLRGTNNLSEPSEESSYLEGEKYEEECADLFEQIGFTVSTTRKSGDFGADLVLMM